MREVLFTKYSMERSPQFAIRTSIVQDGAHRWAEKAPLTQEAAAHVKRLASSYDELCRAYKGTRVYPCPVAIENGVAKFEFLAGEFFHEKLGRVLAAKDEEGIIALCKEFVSIVKSGTGVEKFQKTPEFVRVFGDVDLPDGLMAMPCGNMEWNFGNLIGLENGDIALIDYEWFFDFPVPQDYVLYRSLYYSFFVWGEQNLADQALCSRLGISADLIPALWQMERHFNLYVARGDCDKPLWFEYAHILRRSYSWKREAAQQQEELARKQQEAAQQWEELARKQQELAQQQGEAAYQQAQAAFWKGAVEGVLRSKSWKVTKPLRRISRLLRKLLGRSMPPEIEDLLEEHIAFPNISADGGAKTVLNEGALGTRPYRILLVSYFCPTRAHAGGLRILDIYKMIRDGFPQVQLTLFTCRHEEIDWKYDEMEDIFNQIFFSDTEDLSYQKYVQIAGQNGPYDVIDFQFLQAASNIAGYRKSCCGRILFTPMELLSKAFYDKCRMGRNKTPRQWLQDIRTALVEMRCAEQADLTVCVSRSDAAFLREVALTGKICALETGISELEFPMCHGQEFVRPAEALERNVLLYMAYFGSPTNLEALEWYLTKVHPIVKMRVPDYQFKVVGRGDLSSFVGFDDENVEFVGAVESLGGYIQEAKVGIAPALSGAGFRGKINQYAIYGVPCVCNQLSIEGLAAYQNGKDILIADDPEGFAECCIQLLLDSACNNEMGAKARETCCAHYTWQAKKPEIAAIYSLPVSPKDKEDHLW